MSVNRPRPNFKQAGAALAPLRPINLIPNTSLGTASAIKDYLEANFKPLCIGVNERVEDAHRRAGAVELATRLIATIEWSQEHRSEETLEE